MIVLILAIYSALAALVVMALLITGTAFFQRRRMQNMNSRTKEFPRSWAIGLTFLTSVIYMVLISLDAGEAGHMGPAISIITGAIGGALAMGPVLWLSRLRFAKWAD